MAGLHSPVSPVGGAVCIAPNALANSINGTQLGGYSLGYSQGAAEKTQSLLGVCATSCGHSATAGTDVRV